MTLKVSTATEIGCNVSSTVTAGLLVSERIVNLWNSLLENVDFTTLDFCTNTNNSPAVWVRLMKFCRSVTSYYRKQVVWPKLATVVNSRWRRPPFWIQFTPMARLLFRIFARTLTRGLILSSYVRIDYNIKQKLNPRWRW